MTIIKESIYLLFTYLLFIYYLCVLINQLMPLINSMLSLFSLLFLTKDLHPQILINYYFHP
jgi:hypothetical protein